MKTDDAIYRGRPIVLLRYYDEIMIEGAPSIDNVLGNGEGSATGGVYINLIFGL